MVAVSRHAEVRAARALLWSAAAGLTVLCGLAWRLSLDWPSVHDLPIMLYTALLWDRFDVLPHAGFFDMNLLGSYLSYVGIGRLFGYDAAGVRIADLAIFLGLAGATLAVLRSAGLWVGWIAATLFGLVYLQYGPGMSLQREYLMLVPLALAVAAATAIQPGQTLVAGFAAGLGVGAAMTLKPQAAVAIIPLAAFLAFEATRERDGNARFGAALRVLAAMAAGTALVLGLLFAALAWLGVTSAFFEIVVNYLPLYGEMTGLHRILEPGERLHYLQVHWLRFGRQPGWVIAGAVGAAACAVGLRHGDPLRSRVALLAGLAATFAFYPLLAGKFWNYHWLPMVYWLVLCACLGLHRLSASRLGFSGFAVALLLAAMGVRAFPPTENFGGLLATKEATDATAVELSNFLNARLRPGDTVQPMDWTKASIVHALLLSEAKAATSFIYDFHFYHHVSHPYIRQLRRRFMTELEEAHPRFIIRSRLGPFPTGRDTSRLFPQLGRLLRTDYVKVSDTLAYTIYERRPEPAAPRESIAPERVPSDGGVL